MKKNTDLKYPLNNPDGKVSIRYYLNTKLKPEILSDGTELYPLYFQLVVKTQATLNRSRAKNNRMSIVNFEKIRNVVNAKEIRNIGKAMMPLVSNDLSMEEQEHNVRNLFMPILMEKRLIYDIVADLKPFNRANFNVKEFNENFEMYNSEIKPTISKIFTHTIKWLLEDNPPQNNGVLADNFLKIIDWNNANAFRLWSVLKDKFEQVNFLIKKYPYCFQILSGVNINNLPDNEVWVIDFFAKQTYSNIESGLKFEDDLGFKGRSPMYDNPLFDPICKELKLLFFGK